MRRTPHSSTRILPAGLLLLSIALAGSACGSDESSSTTSTSPSPTSAGGGATTTSGTGSTPTDATGARFTMDTADGSVKVEGPTSRCDDSPPDTLELIFAAGDSTVTATVNGGTGSVRVAGTPEFEGRVDSATVGSDGRVHLGGHGTPADDSANPTTFTIEGTCR